MSKQLTLGILHYAADAGKTIEVKPCVWKCRNGQRTVICQTMKTVHQLRRLKNRGITVFSKKRLNWMIVKSLLTPQAWWFFGWNGESSRCNRLCITSCEWRRWTPKPYRDSLESSSEHEKFRTFARSIRWILLSLIARTDQPHQGQTWWRIRFILVQHNDEEFDRHFILRACGGFWTILRKKVSAG